MLDRDLNVDTTDGEIDSRLLEAARSDADAFATFFDRNYALVLKYFARRIGTVEDAADLCAETFAEALDGLERFNSRLGNGRQWLFGIAGNLLLRYWRTQRVSRLSQERLAITRTPVDGDTIAAMSRAEALADGNFVADAMRSLPKNTRRATILRVGAQLSYEEIAADLGCTEETARQRVHRGLARLRRTL